MPWIEPEDVAAAVVFLASARARYVTGSEFILDAGLAHAVKRPRRRCRHLFPDQQPEAIWSVSSPWEGSESAVGKINLALCQGSRRGPSIRVRVDQLAGDRLIDMGTATTCRLSSTFPRSGPEPTLICMSYSGF